MVKQCLMVLLLGIGLCMAPAGYSQELRQDTKTRVREIDSRTSRTQDVLQPDARAPETAAGHRSDQKIAPWHDDTIHDF